MRKVFACPICGSVKAYYGEGRILCPECNRSTLIETDYPIEKIPDLHKVSFYEYYAYCREVLETIIEPLGQLDKTSLEYNVNYSEYYKVPLSPEYQAQYDARQKESLARATAEIARDKRLALESQKPKCPTCGSTNIHSIGGLERAGSVAMLGLFSKKINKSFKCNQCGYTW